MKPLAPAALTLTLALASQGAEDDLAWRLYVASVSAADALLRLHETDLAKRWLAEAPEEHRGFEWRYLASQAEQSRARFEPHSSSITDLALSPDGRLLAASFGDASLRLIDAATGATRHVLTGHSATTWSPAFSPDGRRLASASSDGTVRLWDVESGAQQKSLAGNGRGTAALAFGPDELLAVCSWERSAERGVWGVITLWDAASGERLLRIEHGEKPITSLAFSPDGKRLAAGTWDFDVALFDVGRWSEPARLFPPPSDEYLAVRDLAFSPDGRELAVAYADGRARLWDVERRSLTRTLFSAAEGAAPALNDVVYLGSEAQLATLGDRSEAQLATLGHESGVQLATVGDDLTLRRWDPVSGKLLATLHGHERSVTALVADAAGARVYTGDESGELRVWDGTDARPSRWSLPSTAYALAFDPTGERWISAGWEGWLRIAACDGGGEIRAWQGHEQSAVGVDWSADGRFLASTGNAGDVVLWTAEGERVRELQRLGRQLLCAAFRPDSALLAAPGKGAAVQLWSVPGGEPRAALAEAGDVSPVGYLDWSPDGARLAAGHADGSVRVWDVDSATIARRVGGHPPGQVALAFHPGGSELASASGRDVRVTDLASGATRTLPSAASSVLFLAYSPDGTRLAAALDNNTLEIWHAPSGRVLLRLPYTAGVFWVGWSRTGEELYALPMDKTVSVLSGPKAQ